MLFQISAMSQPHEKKFKPPVLQNYSSGCSTSNSENHSKLKHQRRKVDCSKKKETMSAAKSDSTMKVQNKKQSGKKHNFAKLANPFSNSSTGFQIGKLSLWSSLNDLVGGGNVADSNSTTKSVSSRTTSSIASSSSQSHGSSEVFKDSQPILDSLKNPNNIKKTKKCKKSDCQPCSIKEDCGECIFCFNKLLKYDLFSKLYKI